MVLTGERLGVQQVKIFRGGIETIQLDFNQFNKDKKNIEFVSFVLEMGDTTEHIAYDFNGNEKSKHTSIDNYIGVYNYTEFKEETIKQIEGFG